MNQSDIEKENLELLSEITETVANGLSSKNVVRYGIQNENLSKKEALLTLAKKLGKEKLLQLNKHSLEAAIKARDRHEDYLKKKTSL